MSHEHQYTNEELEALYHGDQSKLYSGILAKHHGMDSPESKAKIKKIVEVTVILTAITIIEVILGLYGHKIPHGLLNTLFLLFTLAKAYFIVKVFMHLGEERKFFKRLVILPLLFLVWFVVSLLVDGRHMLHINDTMVDTRPVTGQYE